MDLRRLSMSFEDEQNVWYLLQNAKLLEELHLLVDRYQDFEGLFSPSASTLKVLDLTLAVFFYDEHLVKLCEELEAMVLEALSFEVQVCGDKTEDR